MENYDLEQVKTEALIPYALNSRKHSDEQVTQIAASIREFGFTNPVLIDEKKNLIAGHGRLMAAKKLGLDEVPAIVVTGLSNERRRALIIADNKISLNAGWDMEALTAELKDLAPEFGELMGFSEDELAALLPNINEGLTEQDEVPAIPDNAVTKLGDVWTLGKHRVMCGSAVDQAAVEKLCGDQAIDLLLTDPPYNVAYVGKTKDALTIQNDSLGDDEFRGFLRDAFVSADTVMKPGAAFYIFLADREGYNFLAACRDTNWRVRQWVIWAKNHMVMGRQDYHSKHEPCLYGWKEGASHLWAADRKQTTILEFDRPSRSEDHPTMKPVALFEYLLLNNTKGSDIVLDCFGGSGTTLIAAEKNGRVARLMELEPKYCDVMVRRWMDYTGETAVNQRGEAFKIVD